MRYALLLLIPAIALLMAADDKTEKDKKALQGTWKVISFEKDGKAEPAEVTKEMKFTIKDDTFSLTDGKRTESGKFTLDSSKKPKELDGTPDKGGGKALFIYEINGDSLKLCWNKDGVARPKEFASKGAAGYMTLKRQK